MIQTIDQVTAGLMQFMLEQGLNSNTVQTYPKRFFYPLQAYFKSKNCMFYSKSLIEDYLQEKTKLFLEGKICKKYFLQWKRMLRLITEFSEKSTCDLSYHFKPRFLLSADYNNIFSIISSKEKNTNSLYIFKSLLYFFDSQKLKLEQINDEEILKYIASKNNILRYEHKHYLILFTRFLKEQKISEITIDFSLWKIHEPRKRLIKPFSEDEILQLLKYIRENAASGKRNEVMILTAISTGLRGIDLVQMKLKDIDWKYKVLNLTQSKTRKLVSIPLNSILLNSLSKYILETRPESEYQEIFLSLRPPYKPITSKHFRIIFEEVCNRTGLQKISLRSLHCLRRTFAVALSESHVPLPFISQLLGHTNINSDRPYLTYDTDMTMFCASDFSEIPLHGFYRDLLRGKICHI